jgi:hypothetical protein
MFMRSSTLSGNIENTLSSITLWAVLQFMQDYDSLPQAEVVRAANYLKARLGMLGRKHVLVMLPEQASNETDYMPVTIFDRGEVKFGEESITVLKSRNDVPALYAMERWSMSNVSLHWAVQSKSESTPRSVSRARVVSPHDLSCFKILDTEIFSLAATRVGDGDRM